MKNRSIVAAVTVVLAGGVFAPLSATGQETAPRTPWGHPDLQGTYTSKTITPLERPAGLADRERLTAEEVADLEQEVVDRNAELAARPARRTEVTESVDVGEDGAPGFYNNFWLDRGVTSTGRTSIIVDPSDGRLPSLTPEAQRDEDARLAERATRGPADTWTDMDLNDRCMLWSVGPPMLPTGYNNNYLILQTPDYVVIHVEMIHDTRIIPLDGRPRLDRPIPQWLGEMRGRWEGDTLVVETRNIARSEEGSSFGNDVVRIRAANGGRTESLRVIERFTRVDTDTLRYEFTVEDPTRWTRPWSGELPLRRTGDSLFEYACHEGNYSIVNMLSGARAQELR
ncbi:MAG: hypothetical protein F4Y45_08565 [Acidobacteria bacterium]|nr:hypothetical protein [Acidobacteriota bacterium]MYD69799.1 hypothetical protein [Acidobacteriota bacterium]MYJ03675.1 hypothetical protein [Acidobacteriota bacterium]